MKYVNGHIDDETAQHIQADADAERRSFRQQVIKILEDYAVRRRLEQAQQIQQTNYRPEESSTAA